VNEFGTAANSNDIPDFRGNTQKTKPFFKRLELGTNVQTLRPTGLFPSTSDLGLSVGFKLSDDAVIGAGASYKIGWGKDIQHVKITQQGAGLRSFLDIKLKKTYWITGGFEMNYRTIFHTIEQLKNRTAWQQSCLIGISKKLPLESKLIKKANAQLLFDFLSAYQVPRTQSLIFRIGYNF
jgi:hypothetical protein